MKFDCFFESLFGSRSKALVIHYLLHEGLPSSEREIARRLGLSNAAVNNVFKEFASLNLVLPVKVGSATVWRLNLKSYAYEVVQRLKESQDPFDELVRILKQQLRPFCSEAYVYGSVSTRTEVPGSDVDVFAVAKDMKKKEEVLDILPDLESAILEKFGNRLQLVLCTKKEASKIAGIYKKATNGIMLFG